MWYARAQDRVDLSWFASWDVRWWQMCTIMWNFTWLRNSSHSCVAWDMCVTYEALNSKANHSAEIIVHTHMSSNVWKKPSNFFGMNFEETCKKRFRCPIGGTLSKKNGGRPHPIRRFWKTSYMSAWMSPQYWYFRKYYQQYQYCWKYSL